MVSARVVFLGLASIIVGYQIFVPPVVGLANNGDFGKVIGVFNLTGPIQDENAWADTRWEFNPRKHYWAGFYSSEHLLLGAAIAINCVLSKDGYFDLRAIGLVHGALLILAFDLLWRLLEDRPRALRIATCGAALFCFTDVMYVSYLNSFYMDVATVLFLSIAAMLYLRLLAAPRWPDALAFVFTSAMAIASKPQHAVFGFWLAAVLIGASPRWPQMRKWTLAFAAFLSLLSAFWIAKAAPPNYGPVGVFTVTFGRILPHSKHLDRTMADLSLDDSYRRYIGTHAYSDGSPIWDDGFVERFRRRISYASLAWFYLTHPRDAYLGLRLSLNEAGGQRPYLGNFDAHAGYGRFQASQAFALWSDLKKRAFDQKGPRYFFTFLALVAALGAMLGLEWRTLPAGAGLSIVALMGMAVTALLVASLADAVDIPRHHLLFYFLSDVMVVVLVHLIVRRWSAPTR
jgi:hypothetical protein